MESLNEKNIVHRVLKLGNIVLNGRVKKITITYFCLGKHLFAENDSLRNQRGRPDIFSCAPYSERYVGVERRSLLNALGQYPLYDSVPRELFRKVKAADFKISTDGRVTDERNSNLASMTSRSELK